MTKVIFTIFMVQSKYFQFLASAVKRLFIFLRYQFSVYAYIIQCKIHNILHLSGFRRLFYFYITECNIM